MNTSTTSEPAVLDLARRTAERLAEHAAAVDSGADPRPSYQIIKESGLLSVLLPRAAGGRALSFTEYTKVLEELALGDGAAALGFNMHNVAIGSLCEAAHADLPKPARRFRDWTFEQVADHGKMFASATSEPGSGAKLRGLSTTYERVGDGYVLHGRKSFVSLAGVADYYVVAAVPEGADGHDEVSHFVVAKDDPGVTFGDVWDGIALRGTETASMNLNKVALGEERLFLGVDGVSLFKLVREPHWMVAGYLGAYLGIAGAIVRYATEFVAATPGRRDSPVVRAELAELVIQLAAVRSLTYTAAGLVDEQRGSLAANTAVHAAKYLIGEVAPRLAVSAARICGSAGVRQGAPLGRLLRESAFCAVMPAKPHECLEYIGKATLGFNMFHAHTVEW
ncbi:acyl-CoA dehydrogenase family protein [Streptomyces sp. NPDC005963]|uniref:acyl-CoA dehydrogenase family protein n=1 Tax=Streptomyces sp. NPDC005963 TaxID=3156721 RepID=UPI0033DFF8CA